MRRFLIALTAVAVLACTASSVAGASTATVPAGAVAPVGTRFTTTGSDFIMQSNLLGTITCSTLNLNGEITKNSGGLVEGSGVNTSPEQSGCKTGEKAVTITSFEISKFLTSTSGKGTWSFAMKTDIASLGCIYTGTNVPFTYTSGTNVMQFAAATATGIVGSPASCGTTKFQGSFVLESGSTPLILD
jgi:hypothetical protein